MLKKFILIISSIICISSLLINQSSIGISQSFTLNHHFIKGVCHPTSNCDDLKEANIEWVRFDIPYPFNKDGSVSQEYIDFKDECKKFHENGIKVMAITPYPASYIDAGVDPRTDKEGLKKTALFLLNDLKKYIGAIQVTNELESDYFRSPLTYGEAVDFIGSTLQAIYPHRGNLLVGFNFFQWPKYSEHKEDYFDKLKKYLRYVDFVGLDVYPGSSANWSADLFEYFMCNLHDYFNKPLIITEFGYHSTSKVESEEWNSEVLKEYGYNSEEELTADIVNFINNKATNELKRTIITASNGDETKWAQLLLTDYRGHFYRAVKEEYSYNGIPHTLEGQAEFFRQALAMFDSEDYISGCFAYCYTDSKKCWSCGSSHCFYETKWGLVDCNGNKKPAYYAVKEAYAKIK